MGSAGGGVPGWLAAAAVAAMLLGVSWQTDATEPAVSSAAEEARRRAVEQGRRHLDGDQHHPRHGVGHDEPTDDPSRLGDSIRRLSEKAKANEKAAEEAAGTPPAANKPAFDAPLGEDGKPAFDAPLGEEREPVFDAPLGEELDERLFQAGPPTLDVCDPAAPPVEDRRTRERPGTGTGDAAQRRAEANRPVEDHRTREKPGSGTGEAEQAREAANSRINEHSTRERPGTGNDDATPMDEGEEDPDAPEPTYSEEREYQTSQRMAELRELEDEVAEKGTVAAPPVSVFPAQPVAAGSGGPTESRGHRLLREDAEETRARIAELERQGGMNWTSYDELTAQRVHLREIEIRLKLYEEQGAHAVNEYNRQQAQMEYIKGAGVLVETGVGLANVNVVGQSAAQSPGWGQQRSAKAVATEARGAAKIKTAAGEYGGKARVARDLRMAREAGAARRAAKYNFRKPDGTPSGVSKLVPGEAGQQQLGKLMGGFESTQKKVFVDSINKYADDMIAGRFDWKRIPDGERIVLDGNRIVHGHHRFVSAKIAADVTGRPLMGAPNAIIPKEGFMSAGNARKLIGNKPSAPFCRVGAMEGAKPPTPTQSVDDELRAIREMSGPED
jgi:hypothetical protein